MVKVVDSILKQSIIDSAKVPFSMKYFIFKMTIHFLRRISDQIRKFLRIERVRVEVVQNHLNHTKQDRDAKVAFYNQSKHFR